MDKRPAIPAAIERRVLVEAGHRCAIPTCRYIEVEIHHIIPWEKRRKHEYDNLIALCANCHRRADRGEIDRKSLRIYKANLRFAHDKFSNIEVDILYELRKIDPNKGILWPRFNILLIKRIIDAGYIIVKQQDTSVSINGMVASPDVIFLTDSGREFLDSIEGQ